MSNQPKHFYEFGPFRLDPAKPRLWRGGETVALTPKALELLLELVQHGGKLVEKDELMQKLWPDTVVEEGNLSVHIFALRKALGETDEGHSYIETLPRRGYRFAAHAREVGTNGAGLVVERYSLSRVIVEEQEADAADEISQAAPESLEPAKTRPPIEAAALAAAGGRSRAPTGGRRRAVLAALAFALGLTGALAYLWQANPRKPPATMAEVKSMAVLPLKTLGAGTEDEYLGVGLADALITRFGRVSQVVVPPTSVVLKYAGAEQDALAVGKALGVEAVLEGNVQTAGERLRVTIRLLRVSDGVSLWAGQFDEKFTDIFAVQDSISEQVSRTLKLDDGERQQLYKRYTESTQAYQAYLKGRYFWNRRTREGFEKAIEYFSLAIDSDPDFALAYAGLGDTYGLMGQRGMLPPRDAYPKARAATSKALKIDETLAEAHVTLGFVMEQYDLDWPGAEREFKRALEINPRYAYAYGVYGMHLLEQARFGEAFPLLKRGEELDPLSPIYAVYLGWNYHYARRYDQAIAQCGKALEIDPDFRTAHAVIGSSYEQKGMYDEAVAHYLRVVDSDMIESLKEAYAASGIKGFSRRRLELLTEASRKHYVSACAIAELHAMLGEKEQALAWLQKAYEERAGGITFIKVKPTLDGLRPDPRFQGLLRRVGLAQGD